MFSGGFKLLVDTFTVTPSVMLLELLVPVNTLLQSFVSNFNDSLGDLSISDPVDPESCNAQVSLDFSVIALVRCTLIIDIKPLL